MFITFYIVSSIVVRVCKNDIASMNKIEHLRTLAIKWSFVCIAVAVATCGLSYLSRHDIPARENKTEMNKLFYRTSYESSDKTDTRYDSVKVCYFYESGLRDTTKLYRFKADHTVIDYLVTHFKMDKQTVSKWPSEYHYTDFLNESPSWWQPKEINLSNLELYQCLMYTLAYDRLSKLAYFRITEM
jgi:hypothetical protein